MEKNKTEVKALVLSDRSYHKLWLLFEGPYFKILAEFREVACGWEAELRCMVWVALVSSY